jgi:hypothetical protein
VRFRPGFGEDDDRYAEWRRGGRPDRGAGEVARVFLSRSLRVIGIGRAERGRRDGLRATRNAFGAAMCRRRGFLPRRCSQARQRCKGRNSMEQGRSRAREPQGRFGRLVCRESAWRIKSRGPPLLHAPPALSARGTRRLSSGRRLLRVPRHCQTGQMGLSGPLCFHAIRSFCNCCRDSVLEESRRRPRSVQVEPTARGGCRAEGTAGRGPAVTRISPARHHGHCRLKVLEMKTAIWPLVLGFSGQ